MDNKICNFFFCEKIFFKLKNTPTNDDLHSFQCGGEVLGENAQLVEKSGVRMLS